MKIASSALSVLPGVRHAFFTREGGASEGLYTSLNGGLGSKDDPAHVAENRRRMAHALDVSADHFLTVYQIHSADAVIATQPWDATSRPHADAMVTNMPGLAIGVTAADCGPILFAEPQARVIGAAHAGWKGALGGVLEATITAMEKLGAARTNILAAIGPLIRQQNYEVGAEFVARFNEADAANARFFVPSSRADHAMFDLAGYIRARLEHTGIKAIDDVDLCTYADPRFFSYRRAVHRAEPDYGRNIHAIVLEG
ncbi:MAG: peptidoglycan editing factor PgeF [Xanthobacteraceae bacterium]|nr:peptidoglycan editing factor PgeF [Xanthobacteraceae bacterium]